MPFITQELLFRLFLKAYWINGCTGFVQATIAQVDLLTSNSALHEKAVSVHLAPQMLQDHFAFQDHSVQVDMEFLCHVHVLQAISVHKVRFHQPVSYVQLDIIV